MLAMFPILIFMSTSAMLSWAQIIFHQMLNISYTRACADLFLVYLKAEDLFVLQPSEILQYIGEGILCGQLLLLWFMWMFLTCYIWFSLCFSLHKPNAEGELLLIIECLSSVVNSASSIMMCQHLLQRTPTPKLLAGIITKLGRNNFYKYPV